MKKVLPYLITFVVVLIAVVVAQSMTTIKEVDENGKPVEGGKAFKAKFGGSRKKK